MTSSPNYRSAPVPRSKDVASTLTNMEKEIREIPEAVQRLLDRSRGAITKAADDLRRVDPHCIVTVARGSSDHAAAYLKYATELIGGIPVASVGPSIASVYGAQLRLGKAVCVAISQSGRSPDIVEMTETCRRGGAMTVALTNDMDSPLAKVSEHPVSIEAGLERSVAATKTFVNSVLASLLLLATWQHDEKLLAAIDQFPADCRKAIDRDWSLLAERLVNESSLYILGRGPAMAIAEEAALKFKETCQIHAESYSSAEVMHGPVSIVGRGFPLLVLAARDAAETSVVETAESLSGQGAEVFVTSDRAVTATHLPVVATTHPLTDPLMLIVSFYAFIERLARSRGLDPDNPPNLRKVTETV